jgi:hypothetical protein
MHRCISRRIHDCWFRHGPSHGAHVRLSHSL